MSSCSRKRKLNDLAPTNNQTSPDLKRRKLQQTNQNITNNNDDDIKYPVEFTIDNSNTTISTSSKIYYLSQPTINELIKNAKLTLSDYQLNNYSLNIIDFNHNKYEYDHQLTDKFNLINNNTLKLKIKLIIKSPKSILIEKTNELSITNNNNTKINKSKNNDKEEMDLSDDDTNNENENDSKTDKNEINESETKTDTTAKAAAVDPYNQYNWKCGKIILRATSSFRDVNNDHYKYLDGGNFLKSIIWSPNGYHLLSNSNDRKLRLYNPLNDIYYNKDIKDINNNNNEMIPSVVYQHSEPVYDTSFYPLFKTNDYSSNVFISCSRDSPIYMFDSWQNNIRSSYKYIFGDILITPYSITFDNNGENIYAGYKKYIIKYQISNSKNITKINCVNRNNFGQKTIISCIKFMNLSNNIFACGSYDGLTQIFDIRSCKYSIAAFKCVKDYNKGITDILFSPCNNYLLTGSRKFNDIYCWDLRYFQSNYCVNNSFINGINMNKFNDGNIKVYKDNDSKNKILCAKYCRNIVNHQKVSFDIDKYTGYWIVSGNQNNNVCNVYDVTCNDFNVEPKYKLKHDDNVKSVSSAKLCPTYPFLATTIGQRVISNRNYKNNNKIDNNIDNKMDTDSDSDSDSETDDDDDDMQNKLKQNVNDICIWDLRTSS